MTKPEPSRAIAHMNEWSAAFERINPRLSAQLAENRADGIRMIDELGLPHYKTITTPLADFLLDPSSVTTSLGSDRFYITLFPRRNERRYTAFGLNEQEVLEYIDSQIGSDSRNEYELVIQQFFENLYGGTIVINPDGAIYIEFHDGPQSPVSQGTIVPKYRAHNDPFTGTMRYSFENETLRSHIYQTLQTIPHEGIGRETTYLPGYYEFSLVRPDENSDLRPIFFDYKDNPVYFMPTQ